MQTLLTDPWRISEAEYPASGTPAEKLEWMLGWAVLAPSAHNSQPWRFRVGDGEARLYADRTRALPVVDPRDRALTISCGAALFFLRLALRRFGWTGEVEIFPDAADPDLLAIVRPGEPADPSPEVLRLFAAIGTRHTHRMSFHDCALPSATVERLVEAAADEGAWLRVIDDRRDRTAIAEMAREGDRIQFSDPDFRRELSGWVRTNHTPRHDGMPGSAFGIPDIVSPLGATLMGAVNLGVVWGGRSHQAAENAPLLAVLGTAGDAPSDWLAAGQALARALLAAAAEGVAAAFLNQPCEVPELRLRLRELLGTGVWPQLVLRMGYPPHAAPPTPRRTVAEVLER